MARPIDFTPPRLFGRVSDRGEPHRSPLGHGSGCVGLGLTRRVSIRGISQVGVDTEGI